MGKRLRKRHAKPHPYRFIPGWSGRVEAVGRWVKGVFVTKKVRVFPITKVNPASAGQQRVRTR